MLLDGFRHIAKLLARGPLESRAILDERQNRPQPGGAADGRGEIGSDHPIVACRGNRPGDIPMERDGKGDLPEVRLARARPSRLPRRLHSGQEQADHRADHRHDDEQLDERHAGTSG